jgi:hypothetical protein
VKLINYLNKNGQYVCPKCKKCKICQQGPCFSASANLYCSICDELFHYMCEFKEFLSPNSLTDNINTNFTSNNNNNNLNNNSGFNTNSNNIELLLFDLRVEGGWKCKKCFRCRRCGASSLLVDAEK